MAKNISPILKGVLNNVKPTKEEVQIIEKSLKEFLKKLEKNKRKARISAEIFVGGSFAKKTMIKKNYYDLDIFIRFDKKHKENELSHLTQRILHGISAEKIHGSRDYFRVKINEKVFFEIVPVRKIKNPKEADNVTDLSYSHVSYIKRKVKNEKILDEIRLAKAFTHATKSYGAESYIRGFSGYGLELLIHRYRGFIKFLKEMIKIDVNKKEVIDIENYYKSKSQALMDLNEAKLQSPIILIDPTYKQRNVLAALSEETFKKFQSEAKRFLKNPSKDFFESKNFNADSIMSWAKKSGYDIIVLEAETNKQEGDIAGTKLLKFGKHLDTEIGKLFNLRKMEFEYHGKTSGNYVFVAKPKKEILVKGPDANDKKNAAKFRNKHKKVLIKNNRLYVKYKPNLSLTEFVQNWKSKNKKRMKEMHIISLDVLS